MNITEHAQQRWDERFPGQDMRHAFIRAKPTGRKTKRAIREACPGKDSFMRGGFKGVYYNMTDDRIVFVLRPPETIITVFRLEPPMPSTKPASKHAGCKRTYIQLSRAFYATAVTRHKTADFIDELNISLQHPGGGSTGEFAIEWVNIGPKVSPRLRAYDDAWSALAECRDLLEAMAEIDGQDVSIEQFRGILNELGFKDITPTEPE